MIDIPVLCDAEHLPRVRLLMGHMQTLGIRLKLVEEADPQAGCVLLVPRASRSPLADVAKAEYTSVVLYLDHNAEPIGGDLNFQIPAWPARSSDKDVRRLASALRTGRKETAPDPDAGKRRFDRNNLIALGVLALMALGLYGLTQTSTANREAERDQVDRAPPAQTIDATTTPRNNATVAPADRQPAGEGGMTIEAASDNRLAKQTRSRQSADSEIRSGQVTSDAAEPTMLAIAVPVPLWPTLPLYICPASSPGPQPKPRGLICEPLFDESEQLFR